MSENIKVENRHKPLFSETLPEMHLEVSSQHISNCFHWLLSDEKSQRKRHHPIKYKKKW
jgi:hypothetical protein